MKTRDRILKASLNLFNSEGEENVSALDVANALEISPGNLYYHFKGKDALIAALFDNFEEEISLIFQGAENRLQSLEDHWLFLYIMLEEIYDFRFFYKNLGVLTDRYPRLAARFQKLTARLRQTLEISFQSFVGTGTPLDNSRIRSVVLDQLISTLTFWLEEDAVNGQDTSAPELIHKTVLRTLLHVAPYLKGDARRAHDEILALYDQALA